MISLPYDILLIIGRYVNKYSHIDNNLYDYLKAIYGEDAIDEWEKGDYDNVLILTAGAESAIFKNRIPDMKKFRNLKCIELRRIKVISNSAFWRCHNLKHIKLKGVTSIGSSAFWGCRNLETIELNAVTHIRNSAFWECWIYLEAIEPKAVTHIGNKAF